nr:hypothetical protein [Tanacetum cinerariifolium]
MCELVCQIAQKKQEEKRIEEEQAASARYWKIPACCDDDDDYNSAITPVLSTEEPVDSLSMGDEHLDTISATESDKVIKSSVENLVPIPSEFEESKLLIDELDFPYDFLPYSEYDSFNSQNFSRDDDLPSTNNEDMVFNTGILIQEKPITIITRVAQEKKLAISKASLVFEDFDPPFYEP